MERNLQVLTGILLAALLVPACLGSERNASIPSREETTTGTHLISPTTSTSPLPSAEQPDAFSQNRPIWAHSSVPAAHEVVLFRRTFTLAERLEDAQLALFADTRYEAWVDGSWVGRGPARFSRTTREYDVHEMGPLQPGDHLVAILVQWSPNTRRSESVTPLVAGHVQGVTAQGIQVVERTGPAWKALLSPAWRQDAAPAHPAGLIGPTWFLSTYVLRDRRTGPDTWLAQPAFSGVRHASGSLPLEEGMLQIHWEGQRCEERMVELEAPPTTSGELVIPFIDDTTILTLNEQVIWQKGAPTGDNLTEQGDGIHVSLPGGNHTLRVHEDCEISDKPALFD
jgi:hypothetical protein